MHFNFFIYRIFCIFPYTWAHKNNKCHFAVSLPWVTFAVASVGFITYKNISTIDTYKWETLSDFFTSLNKLITSALYMVIVLTLNLRPKPWAQQLNITAEMVNNNVCETGKVFLRKIQIMLVIVTAFLPIMWIAGCLIFEENDFVTNGIIWTVYLHFVPFAFVASFASFILIAINLFLCYSSVLKHVLQYQLQHPISRLDISNKKFALLLGKYFSLVYYLHGKKSGNS